MIPNDDTITISSSDIWNMCKDHDFTLLINKEEVNKLVKLTNKNFKETGDILSLDFDIFPEFLV